MGWIFGINLGENRIDIEDFADIKVPSSASSSSDSDSIFFFSVWSLLNVFLYSSIFLSP
jgi:hypothetical protein